MERSDNSSEDSQADNWFAEFLDLLSGDKRKAFFESYLPNIVRHRALSQLEKANHTQEQMHELLRLLDSLSEKYEQGLPKDDFFFQVFRTGAIYGQYIRGIEGEVSPYNLRKSWHEKLAREFPLFMKNNSLECAKKICQQCASHLWALPENQDTRLGDMCEQVWAMAIDVPEEIRDECKDPEIIQIVDNAMKRMPDKASGLKKWLREVAPSSARRPGAPKK